MALSIRNIKRWYNMLTGKSVWHVNQNIGTCFSVAEIKGYYNNLTAKVTMQPELLDSHSLPLLEIGKGRYVESGVAIFQYGLGAYDLFLLTNEERYHKKFLQCVEWAVRKQEQSGAWDNFSYFYPNHPYGAMAQGEGASLLIRAYVDTGNIEYLRRAQKAIDFMLADKENGGTTAYSSNDVIFLEYPHRKAVFNGWIFAWWGLYDYVFATKDKEWYKECLEKSLHTIEIFLPSFANSYWSVYDLENRIASPFYHNLHIAQMQAMYELTGHEIFNQYAKRWAKQQKNPFCKSLAFVKKAFQKIVE